MLWASSLYLCTSAVESTSHTTLACSSIDQHAMNDDDCHQRAQMLDACIHHTSLASASAVVRCTRDLLR